MARKEKSAVVSKRLVRSLAAPSPLLREAFRSLWSDAQCEAAARGVDATEVLRQAEAWLTALQRLGDDAPFTKTRVAWLAELTVAADDAVAGRVSPPQARAQRELDAARHDVERLRTRLGTRALLLVGGDEKRRAALAIATRALPSLCALLTDWRQEARLRVLADELSLDEGLLAEAALALEAQRDAEAAAGAPTKATPGANVLVGRLLRELQALHQAFATARDAGLAVPTLKVRAALQSRFG